MTLTDSPSFVVNDESMKRTADFKSERSYNINIFPLN